MGQYDQTSFTDPVPIYSKNAANDGPNKFGYSFNSDLAQLAFDKTNHRLFIPDRTNSRVLVYNLNTNNSLADHQADYVLGQTNFYTGSAGSLSQSNLSIPVGAAVDEGNNLLFVADGGAGRVLVYNTSTITNGMNAMNVLGHTDFAGTTNTAQDSMSTPSSLTFDANRNLLYIADQNYNRVLIYNTSTITDGENAVNVLGQPDFETLSYGPTQATMSSVNGIAFDSVRNRLFTSDQGENRVLVFDVSTITNGMNAMNVLGQTAFDTTTAATSQPGMRGLLGSVAFDSVNNRLYVPQCSSANRVTVYDTSTITNGMNAVNVLGQTTFSASSAATTQPGMNCPTAMTIDTDNNRLYVAQANNHRISIFDVASISNGENAVDLLGQYDETNFTDPVPIYNKSGIANSPNRFGYSTPKYVALDATNHRLALSDQTNRRILIYNLNTNNTLIDRIPDYVLGQANFYGNTSTASQPGMSVPRGLTFDEINNRLYAINSTRVLVYNMSSITNGMNAMNVIGNSDFSGNGSGVTQPGLSSPEGIAFDSANDRLYVSGNNRVTVYDTSTITNGENAVNVLGQTTFNGSTGATSQPGMNTPVGLAFDGTNNRLYVAQSTSAHRVTVYDTSTITNGMNAVNVLGQTAFDGGSGAASQPGMFTPQGLAFDATNNRLFVAQSTSANRVTVYDTSTITNGENAINVLGQTAFDGSSTASTQPGLNLPVGLAYDSTNSRLYVSDGTNNRVVVYDAGVPASLSGTVYSDAGSTALGSVTVAVSINGAAAAATADTNGSGAFTLTGVSVSAGDILTFYLDDEAQKAVTVTKGTGSTQTGINLYVNYLITRCDTSCPLTNSNLDTADGNGDSDISAIYSVSGSALTLASGKHLFIPSSHTFAPGGNISLSGHFTNSGTYTKGTETITLTATDSYNLTTNGSQLYALTINGSGGIYTLQDALTLSNNLTITTGTLDTKSGSNYGVSVGGNFSNAGTFTARSGTVTLTSTSASATLTSGGTSFYNLTQNGSGGTYTLQDALDVDNTLTISAGTLDAKSGGNHAITLAGTWSNSGTFTARSGTVTLNGSSQTIVGSTTFYNLTKSVTSAATLTFPASATQTVTGTLTLNGAASNLLSLRSSSSPTKWIIDPQGTRTLSYVDVKDSNNTNATAISCSSNCTNSNNNTNWTFGVSAPSAFSGVAASNTSITWTWTDNATGETGFKLQNSSGTTIATIATANTTSYTETGLTKNTSYTRKVVAYDGSGDSEASDTATVTTNNNTMAAFALSSPDDDALVSTGLPTFSFYKSSVTGGSISSYTLTVGTLTFTGINPQGPTQLADRFTAKYYGENDGNSSNDTISVTLKDYGASNVPLADGSYDWYVTAIDDSAATKNSSTTRSLTVDATSPTIIISSFLPSSLKNSTYTTSSLQPKLTVTTQDNHQLAELTLTAAKANLFLGSISSYTPLETRTYTLSGTEETASFTPKTALTAGSSYRYSLTLTDTAGHSTITTLTLQVLSAAEAEREAAETAVDNLNPETDTTTTIINTLRTLLPASPLNLPQLQEKALLRRQIQADNLNKLTSSLSPFFQELLNRIQQGLLAFLRPFQQATTSLASLLHKGSNQLANAIHLPDNLQKLSAHGQEIRVRQGLKNRQALDQLVKQALTPFNQATHALALKTRAISEILFDKTPTSISNLAITNLTPTSATITWETNHLTKSGKVNYGLSKSYGEEIFEDTRLTDHHQVALPNLSPNSTYYFEVMNQNKDYVYDAYYALTTPAEGTSSQETFKPQMATLKQDEAVRTTPEPTGTIITTLAQGTTYRALKQQDGWISLLLPTGAEGWVPLEAVTLTEQTGISASAQH